MEAKYLELVEQFPLLPITDKDKHKAAKDAKVLVHLILHDFLKSRRGLPTGARLRLAKHFKLDAQVFEFSKKLTFH